MQQSAEEIREELLLILIWNLDFLRARASGTRKVHEIEIEAFEARLLYGRELLGSMSSSQKRSEID